MNKWGAGSRREDSPSMWFPIKGPNGEDVYPIRNDGSEGRWRWGKKKLLKAVEENDVIFEQRSNGTYIVYEKVRGLKTPTSQFTTWFADNYINAKGSESLKSIFKTLMSVFDYAKPINLIKDLAFMTSTQQSIILDFFAGSGTTLHATMQLNAEDGGHRQCILVTNNENGICENVTYERNKRVIQGYTTPKGEHVEGLANNNLRYYKTDFVSRTRSVQNMRRLVNLSTDMLCIKENLYAEQPTFGGERTRAGIFRYFDDGRRQMLVVYREEAIDRLVELICGMDVRDRIKIYVFSPGEDPWKESFASVSDKVELCALPAAIYNAYRRILPKKKDAAATPEEDVATTHKAKKPVNGMLNFTDEGDEA